MKTTLFIPVVLGVLILPSFSSASTVTELHAQLQILTAQLSVLKSQTKSTATSQSGATSCSNLVRNLSRGMRGDDVLQLQQFLISQKYLAADNGSGFYGALTESAVKQFQCNKINICSGSVRTNGYGAAGPKTRAAILASCNLANTTPRPVPAPPPSSNPVRAPTPTPTPTPVPAPTPPPLVPSILVGYWSIGNQNVKGEYISETTAESNIAMIPPDENGSFVPRVQKASSLGLKAVLMVRWTLFRDENGTLYPDYQTRFDTTWKELGTLQESVVGFYLIDEPYINNAGAGASKLSEAQLKASLDEAVTYLKQRAPGRSVMFTEAYTQVLRSDFASLIPEELDYIGVNCYMAFGDSCSDTNLPSLMSKLTASLRPHQKLMVTADGYVADLPPGYSSFTDEVLRSRIIFWENLLAPYISIGKVGAFTPFIYQSIGNSINGLNEFPKARAEVARYMQSIKTGSPVMKRPALLNASASMTASGTYQDQGVEKVRDGSLITGWNSGGFAPQWIQFDLGEAYRVSEIRLTVGQSTSGKTTHVIYVSQDGTTWAPLDTFSQVTATGDVLTLAPAAPAYGVRFVKVETTESPSWVAWPEITISGY